MKTKILLLLLMVGIIMTNYSQEPAITLTFTADNNGQHVPLDSILIVNVTQGGDTTLYAPDTVLVLDYGAGIPENNTIETNVFTLLQNYPNPFQGETTVILYLPKRDNVLITISDLVGRKIFTSEYILDYGKHSFTFLPGKENLYFFTASVGQQIQTIKMFNIPSGSHGSGICILEYNGQQTGKEVNKSGNYLNNFVFNLGDKLRYKASSALGERNIINTPSGNQTYTFQYGSVSLPCPGMPTITDIDGNSYNTVLIGSQCWMKENLKTTTYRNGTTIPNVTDPDEWDALTSGAYVWFDNDISWKDKYGALYNWYTTVDSSGLCPDGWHVPTEDEWDALTDYFGGMGPPHGNELKSCRQVDSSLGGECNTSEHPRWNSNSSNYGTDNYGFSGLPGGYRYTYGPFYPIGHYGYWWTSTENSSNTAEGRILQYSESLVSSLYGSKPLGSSVRCLRD
ncbi:MAG: hypothetical protein K8S16_20655 [Bacteroidales bacterium]|nr:hypothetical protein [Bacteroidales bacterium]